MTSIEELQDAFVRAVELEESYQLVDAYRKNRAAAKVRAQTRGLSSSEEGRRALTELLGHSSSPVRLAAAVAVLAWDQPRARSVIEDLQADENGLLAFNAKMVLRELDDPTSGFIEYVEAQARGEDVESTRSPAVELEPEAIDAISLLSEFHGYVMNGGLAHALEVDYLLARRAAGVLGSLDLPELAAVLSRALAIAARVADRGGEVSVDNLTRDEGRQLEELGNRYEELVPDDDELERRLAESSGTT